MSLNFDKLMEDFKKEWPMERKWKAANKTRGFREGRLMKAIFEKFGDEGVMVIRKVWEEMAKHFFIDGLRKLKIEVNDCRALALYIKLSTGEILGNNVEIVKLSERESIVRLHPPCPLFPDASKVNNKICREGVCYFEKTASKLLNPKIDANFTKLQTEGDPYCEVVIKMLD